MNGKHLFLILLVGSLTSCASYFKRKECEKTNWHDHGYRVAMSGKRLDADDFIKECQKVEAQFSFQEADLGFKEGMSKYCSLDGVFESGRAGKPFNFQMCDGLPMKAMKSRFLEGTRIYCRVENGYPVGAMGATYENVCPKDMESDFLKEYRRGRKTYLTTVIAEKEKELTYLERDIGSRRHEADRVSWELERLERNVRRLEDDLANDQKKDENPNLRSLRSRRDRLSEDQRRLRQESNRDETRIRRIRDEIQKMRIELGAL